MKEMSVIVLFAPLCARNRSTQLLTHPERAPHRAQGHSPPT